MSELRGWLLDLYPVAGSGMVLWLIGEDGMRRRLVQDFSAVFYAAGAAAQLRALWRWLQANPVPVRLSRTRRRDIFQPHPVDLMSIEVIEGASQERLFHEVSQIFPSLTYYDADIRPALRHAAAHGTFPLCRCQVGLGADGKVSRILPLDTPWEIDPLPPPLRILTIQPETDPRRGEPSALVVRFQQQNWRFDMQPPRALLVNLRAVLERCDPDLLLTDWGDGWLLPRLVELSKEGNIPLPLNRDPQMEIQVLPARSYSTYGQVIYRDQQMLLFGRCHIDSFNAMLFHDYGLSGVYEMGRVSRLPLQLAARLSPGSGISAMQIVKALELGILVPWHKQQAEFPKTTWQMIRSDQGGMVYQPLTGIHANVAEIDFMSMYPSIMVHCNISPETTKPARKPGEADQPEAEEEAGLIPQTLAPLLEKRLELKRRLADMPTWDPRRRIYKTQASAHKWLLVTCFGYMGYRNARFGRIEAHEAVTAYGREALLRAKEAAEDLGFTVLHMYVDGLWVQRQGADKPADFQPLLEEITERTGLPISLEGIYHWVTFLPSRQDERVPVPNRYFGVFQDGSLKVRGIELRRRDTPAWVAETQLELMELLAKCTDPMQLPQRLPAAITLLQNRLADLRHHRVPLDQLVVSQKLSRPLAEYTSRSPAARCAAQLQALGRETRPGQVMRFLYTLGEPGVHCWDLPSPADPASLDIPRYTTLLLRAASTILSPLGMDEGTLRGWVISRSGYLASPQADPSRRGETLPLLQASYSIPK